MKAAFSAAALAIALFPAAFVAAYSTPARALDRIGWSKTGETLYLHGDIELGDADKIVAAIRKQRKQLRSVILNSRGGNVLEGAKLTDLMKHYKFDTGVTQGGTCASACFMIWAAGQNRYLYADSRIGIHSASTLNQASGASEESLTSFVITMAMARAYNNLNVPPHLIGQMIITGPLDMYWLNQTDLASMNASLMH